MSEQGSKESRVARVRLLWETSEGEGRESVLTKRTNTIGRSEDCDIMVMDTRASRRHAEIRCQGETWCIADLDSVNGTFVDGDRITEPCRLHDGDLIRTGPVEFRFQVLEAPEAPAEEEASPTATFVVPEPSTLPQLEILSGPQKGVRFELVRDKTVIGRAGHGQQWDLVLQDRAVSRPHAEITREENVFVLADLESANGTLVNGEMISEPHALEDGDTITFGETVVVFQPGEP